MQWGPDGETILTATTAPRLRIGNGFKVWHYSGALLHETVWPVGQELLEVTWQTYSEATFKEKPISYAAVEGIQQSQPQASKAVYVPPNIRNASTSLLGAAPYRPGAFQPAPERSAIPGLPIGYKVSQGQKKRDRKAKVINPSNQQAQSNASVTNPAQSDTNADKPLAPNINNNKKNNNQRKQKPTPIRPAVDQNGADNGNIIPATGNAIPAEGTNQPNSTDSVAKPRNRRHHRRTAEAKNAQAQQVDEQLKHLQLDDKPKKDAQIKPKPAQSVPKSLEPKASQDLIQ